MKKKLISARKTFASLRTSDDGCTLLELRYDDGSNRFKLIQGKDHEAKAEAFLNEVAESFLKHMQGTK